MKVLILGVVVFICSLCGTVVVGQADDALTQKNILEGIVEERKINASYGLTYELQKRINRAGISNLRVAVSISSNKVVDFCEKLLKDEKNQKIFWEYSNKRVSIFLSDSYQVYDIGIVSIDINDKPEKVAKWLSQ